MSRPERGSGTEKSGFQAHLRFASLESSVRACDATPYIDDASVGPGYLKVGEASFAVDPLSSAGVQKSMQTAIAASIVVNTILRRPDSADMAREFYMEEQRRSCAAHAAWSAAAYREHQRHARERFWERRANRILVNGTKVAENPQSLRISDKVCWSDTDRVVRSSDLQIRPAGCLVGRFVEKRFAVMHPSLDRPVAFVEGASLPELLSQIPHCATVASVADVFSRQLPRRSVLHLLEWLIARGLLKIERSAGLV